MSLGKEDFLTPIARKVESVPLPVKGGSVFVRKLVVDEQIQLEAECDALDDGDTKGFTAVRLAFYLSTETGEPFVTLSEMRGSIGKLDPNDIAALMKKGMELNLDPTRKAVVEEAKGNS
jgi:hypothetical protein